MFMLKPQYLPPRIPGVIYIYTLAHPITGEIRYVGKTVDPRRRLIAHRCNKDKGTHKANWIKGLKEQGLNVEMEIIDVVSEQNWEYWEEYWIRQLRAWGMNLNNHDFGGGGNGKCSDETRRKISHKLVGGIKKSQWKAYAQYDTNGNLMQVFESGIAAGKHIGLQSAGIAAASRQGWLCGGYFWKKVIDGVIHATISSNRDKSGRRLLTDQEREKRSRSAKIVAIGRLHTPQSKAKIGIAHQGAKNSASRAIIVYDQDGRALGVWSYIKSACVELNLCYGSVNRVLKGRTKHFNGGYTAAYA